MVYCSDAVHGFSHLRPPLRGTKPTSTRPKATDAVRRGEGIPTNNSQITVDPSVRWDDEVRRFRWNDELLSLG
jgi:hypothetical protein